MGKEEGSTDGDIDAAGEEIPRKIRWRLQVLGHKKTADRCGELTKILKLEFEQREWVVPEPDHVNR